MIYLRDANIYKKVFYCTLHREVVQWTDAQPDAQRSVSCRVVEHGETNRMTTQSVAIVFGPTLLRPETETGNIAVHMIYQNQIVELILLEYESIFGR